MSQNIIASDTTGDAEREALTRLRLLTDKMSASDVTFLIRPTRRAEIAADINVALNQIATLTAERDALLASVAGLREALERVFAVGDGYGPNPNRRGEWAGTTGEGHAECREIARAALAIASKPQVKS